jgi:rhodanese-related sulfurtransferase
MNHKLPALSAPLAGLGLWLLCASVASGITVAELQSQLKGQGKLTVIDVRGPSAFASSHIPGAINVPASLCAQKNLPPLGRVVVCGTGLGSDPAAAAGEALAKKPGITVDLLEGGYGAWEGAQLSTTGGRGIRPEEVNYITYAKLKAASPEDVVLVDLRRQPKQTPQSAGANRQGSLVKPLTDLGAEFPSLRVTPSPFSVSSSSKTLLKSSGKQPLMVLIDSGDGAAQAMVRTLKGNGIARYVILAGGEEILKRQGQAGLQRSGSPGVGLPNSIPLPNPRPQ